MLLVFFVGGSGREIVNFKKGYKGSEKEVRRREGEIWKNFLCNFYEDQITLVSDMSFSAFFRNYRHEDRPS